MSYLHDRWNPRDGSIYANLSSDLSIEWSKADQFEREEIRNAMAQFTPDLFPRFMALPASPDWSHIKIQEDIGANHVHKLLFAMAADEKFLVADRFDAWALDLATAALAMHAKALANRVDTFGFNIGVEFHYWEALEMIFFRDEESDAVIFDAIQRAMECSGEIFSMRSLELLLNAGELYKSALAKLGVNREYVVDLTARCWELHPIVYRGGTETPE